MAGLQIGQAVPEGYSIGGATNETNSGLSVGSPIPDGYTVGNQNQTSSASGAPSGRNPQIPSGPLSSADVAANQTGASRLAGAATGYLKGIGSTIAGVARPVVNAVRTNVQQMLPQEYSGINPEDSPTGAEMREAQGQTQAELAPKNAAENLGYAGESLTEFILGDPALAGIATGAKLMKAAKIAQTLEMSPRIVNALKYGTEFIAKHPEAANVIGNAIRQGAVQAGQTQLKTGDTGQAVKEGLTMGALSGTVGAAGAAIKSGLAAGAKAGKTLDELAKVAKTAPEKMDVVGAVRNEIESKRLQMHTDFENGINDIKDKLKGQTIDIKDNPIARKAGATLAGTEDEAAKAHPFVTQERAPEGFDARTKELLSNLEKGELPAAKTAEGAEGTFDYENGFTPAKKAEPTEVKPWTIDDLVDFRQALRKKADEYAATSRMGFGDPNSRVRRQLMSSVDDTIQKMSDDAAKTDPKLKSVADQYNRLRSDYRTTNGLLESKAIERLSETEPGKAVNDLGKELLTGDSNGKVNALRDLIGSREKMLPIGRDVFKTWMDVAVNKETGRFDPGALLKQVSKAQKTLTEDNFNLLFGTGPNPVNMPPEIGKFAQQVISDAKNVQTVQRLVKAGVIAGIAGTAGVATKLTGHNTVETAAVIIGLSCAAGGMKAGQSVLEFLSTHPALWKTFETGSKIVNSPITAGVANAAKSTAVTQGVGKGNKPPKSDREAMRNVYSGTSLPLGGK